MDRRSVRKLPGMAIIGASTPPSLSVAANKKITRCRSTLRALRVSQLRSRLHGTLVPRRAEYFEENGEIVINRGAPWRGRAGIAAMAAGFFADVLGMKLTCDGVRCAGSHVVYLWTFTGHAAKTGNALIVCGWEEWDVGDDLRVKASRGWYDAEDYERQVAGGAI